MDPAGNSGDIDHHDSALTQWYTSQLEAAIRRDWVSIGGAAPALKDTRKNRGERKKAA